MRVFAGVALGVMWTIFGAAVPVFLERNNVGDVWVLATCASAVTALTARIAGCSLVLREDGISIRNPIFTYRIPRHCVVCPSFDEKGGLMIAVVGDKELEVFAYAGSVVDRLWRTSEKVGHEIEQWLAGGTQSSSARQEGGEVRRSFRWSVPADLALAASAVSGVTALITS
ncbi:hypothetical protein ACWDR5_22110 [Streptomyces koyangensis]